MRSWIIAGALALAGMAALGADARHHAGGPDPAPTKQAAQPAGGAAAPRLQSDSTDAAIAAYVDGYIRDAMDRSGLPGAAIVVVRGGRPILSKGYGWADYATRRPVDPDRTLFRLASISKLFTWIAVMQQVEAGRIQLDRDVNAYLDFRIPPAFGKPITMRHLMTHSPGFADRLHGVFDPDMSVPIRDRLANNVPARVKAPGDAIAYSNYGSALGGHIAERVARTPFETLVARGIYAPVGMTRSSFAQPLPPALAPALVRGYLPGSRDPKKFEMVGTPAAGAMSATPADMGRFIAMLQSGGMGAGGRVLQPQTLAAMMTLDKPLAPGVDTGFGHGFQTDRYRGVRTAGHGGNLSTTATDLVVLPEHGIGWFIAFNGAGNENAASRVRANLTRALIDRFIVPQVPPVKATGPSTAQDAVGRYITTRRPFSGFVRFAFAGETVSVTADDKGVLRVSSSKLSDGSPRRFLPQGRDRFAEQETGLPLVLLRDAGGAVYRIAGAPVGPVSLLERAPAWYGWLPFLLIGGVVLVALGLITWPLGWALRRAYGAPKVPHALMPGRALLAARIGMIVMLATVIGWAIFVSAVDADLDLMFAAGRNWQLMLITGSILSVIGALAAAADAVLAWRDPARGWPRRIGAALTAIGALTIAFLFLYFEMVSFSTDF